MITIKKVGNHNFVDVVWRSGKDTVGIVVIQDEFTGKLKAYIGVGANIDEETDIKIIADWGARLTSEEATPFFPHLKNEDWG